MLRIQDDEPGPTEGLKLTVYSTGLHLFNTIQSCIATRTHHIPGWPKFHQCLISPLVKQLTKPDCQILTVHSCTFVFVVKYIFPSWKIRPFFEDPVTHFIYVLIIESLTVWINYSIVKSKCN